MCKIIIMTGHRPSERNTIIAKAWKYFAKSGERDGYGAAWLTGSGAIGYVRSSSPALARGTVPNWLEGFTDSRHMEERSDGGFLLIHGRTATCDIELGNTHPMLSPESALIHNGMVSSAVYKPQATTCDSEILLRAIEAQGLEGLEHVSGYAALGMIRLTARGPVLHVARDNTAKLHAAKTGHGWVFATTEDALKVAKPIGFKAPLKAWTFLTFRGPRKVTAKAFKMAKETDRIGQWLDRHGGNVFGGDYNRERKWSDWPKSVKTARQLNDELFEYEVGRDVFPALPEGRD